MSELSLWTIYRDPADFPGRYVVRRFVCGRGPGFIYPDPEPIYVGRSLKEARRAIPAEADQCLGRVPRDDPAIVETWC